MLCGNHPEIPLHYKGVIIPISETEYVMDIWMTSVIGHTRTVRINYQQWAGASIDTTDPSYFGFQLPDLVFLHCLGLEL